MSDLAAYLVLFVAAFVFVLTPYSSFLPVKARVSILMGSGAAILFLTGALWGGV